LPGAHPLYPSEAEYPPCEAGILSINLNSKDINLLIQEKTKTLKSDIRKELRVFFPDIGFEISSRQNEGETVFAISYTDGVSRTRVRSVVRQFAHTYHSDRKPVKVIIDVERKMSAKTESLLLAELKSIWKVKGDLSVDDYFPPINGKVKNYLQKIFDMRDF